METNLTSDFKRVARVEIVCRFCLTQENLSNISADDYLQLMICPTLNYYDDEDMPAYICYDCRRLVQHSHSFHRMCKKANKLLTQYQFTGVIPSPLEKPYLPSPKATVEASTNTQNNTSSIGTQTDEEEVEGEYEIINEAYISNNEADDLPKSEIISLDEVYQETTDEQMFSEASILYESCEPDDTLILEDADDELIESNNEATSNNDTESFDCNYCDLSFPLRQLRDIHLNEHNRVRKFQCDKCSKKFYTKKDLNQHETVHTGDKPFKCNLCKKGYTRKSSLDRHESRHAEVPKYLCAYCDKSHPNRALLEEHMKIHDAAQKFTCNICYKNFGFRKNLIRHSAVHQQLYRCDYCEDTFGTQKKLASHLLTHSVADTAVVYYCEKCDQSFTSAKEFNCHMHLHNTKAEKSLNCFYCNSNFKNREEYVKHSAVHSKENLICTLCMIEFQDVQDVDAQVDEHIKLHIKGDLFSCEFCNFCCLTETDLSLHTC